MAAETSPDVSPDGRPARTAMPKSPAALERAIEERRASLAASLDELQRRTAPRQVALRGLADVKAKAVSAVRQPDGSLRVERIAAVAAASVVVTAALVWLRRRR